MMCDRVDKLIANSDKLGEFSKEKVEELLSYGSLNSEALHKAKKEDLDRPGRRAFVERYSWSIPCKEAVDAIIRHSDGKIIYDPMAGTGYWARILQSRGVKVIASDLHIAARHNSYGHRKRHGKLKRANAYQVAGRTMHRNPGHLLLAWPPYNSPLGYNILKLIPLETKVFYLGEGYGGCTGDDMMHLYLDESFLTIEVVELPQFWGLSDNLYIYRKARQ